MSVIDTLHRLFVVPHRNRNWSLIGRDSSADGLTTRLVWIAP